jgi:hypothetical protein
MRGMSVHEIRECAAKTRILCRTARTLVDRMRTNNHSQLTLNEDVALASRLICGMSGLGIGRTALNEGIYSRAVNNAARALREAEATTGGRFKEGSVAFQVNGLYQEMRRQITGAIRVKKMLESATPGYQYAVGEE